jgi:hypothetical protein
MFLTTQYKFMLEDICGPSTNWDEIDSYFQQDSVLLFVFCTAFSTNHMLNSPEADTTMEFSKLVLLETDICELEKEERMIG